MFNRYKYSVEPKDLIGRKITEAKFDGDDMYLTFEDGTKIKIYDDGQNCCEKRYTVCDDDVSILNGKILKDIVVKEVTTMDNEDSSDTHEVAFLEIQTTENLISLTTHNEHNGYYGGFDLTIVKV